jgi:transposase
MTLSNNIVEAALKIPIRIRKNAMFYKTEHGASIANILLSLIETARRADVNPVDYLVALQENKSDVFKNPEAWVPWRYQESQEENPLSEAA